MLPPMKMLAPLLPALLLLLPSLQASTGEKKSKLVTSVLNAKWASTPFTLEASEYLARESNDYYWEFIEFLVEEEGAEGKMTDQEVYDKTVSFASRYLNRNLKHSEMSFQCAHSALGSCPTRN